MGEKCYYCESTDTNYCSLCSNWFCSKCRKRYDKRIISMIKEKFAKKGLEWLTGKEYDERKEAELKKAEDDYKDGRVYTTKELTGLDEEEENV